MTFGLLCGISMAGDWGAWRGAKGNGISEEKGWSPSGITKVLWEKNVGKGYSSVAVVGKEIFTMGNTGDTDKVYCLDGATGTEIWAFSYKCKNGGGYAGPRATPVVDGNDVYTFSIEGHLHCLDIKKGTKKWMTNVSSLGARNLKWNHSSSPLVTPKLVIVNAGAAGMAFDKKTGKKVWGDGGTGGYACPVLFKAKGKECLAIFGEKGINAVDLKSGKKLWNFPWETKYDVHAADPIVTDKWVFISSGYGKGCAMLDISNGKPKLKWQNTNMKNHFPSSVLLGDIIVGCDGNTGGGNLAAIDVQTGKQNWSEGLGFGSLMIADGKVIYLNERGKLTIGKASKSSFSTEISAQVLNNAGICWTMPILANKKIYCRGSSGKLICLDVK